MLREEGWPFRKVAQTGARAVEDAGHGQRVVIAVQVEDAEVRQSQVLRAGGKVEPIGGKGNPAGLLPPTATWRIRPVIVETYLTLGMVDMHVRGGHMASEKRLPEWQDPLLVARPGSLQLVAISEADIPTIVVREVQVVSPKWLLDPVRDVNEGRAIDIVVHALIQMRLNDGICSEAPDVH